MSTARTHLVVTGEPSAEQLAAVVVAIVLRSRTPSIEPGQAAGGTWAAPARHMTGRPAELGPGAWRAAGWLPPPTR
ncbi:hypothetical protein BJY16_003827 [Actinoplanes octamycinicus]|uniref:Acyl-CoA carboxylase epsilon subunit-like protein n=1 Tax=Actinoplanes octamycinicus TaxID=135948 RepID=A0A7W7GY14_9ACTN|nr:acyl-CoA carboxylase epsilon subunit [Actinoplanes octamycinicus]MBB4740368.1 hypothetical protein [Actinoplanes octamycinicus]